MNTILIMIATTAIFFIGIKVGYNLKKGKEKINSPKVQREEEIQNNVTDTESTTELQNREEIERERLNKIMRNLDNFNGTEKGQVNID